MSDIEQQVQPEVQEPQQPEVIQDDDLDITLAAEDPTPPPPDDPKRNQYEHVDNAITNGQIKKRIEALGRQRKIAEERAQYAEAQAVSLKTALSVATQQYEQLRTTAKKTTEGAIEIARDRNTTAREHAMQRLQDAIANGNAEEQAKWNAKLAEAAVDAQVVEQSAASGAYVPEIDPRVKEAAEREYTPPTPKQSQAAVAWAQQNPVFFQPQNAQALQVALAEEKKLTDEGWDIHDPETYQELNRRLTSIIEQAQRQQPPQQQRQAPQQQQPQRPPVNGVGRAAAGVARTAITLTPQERHDADFLLSHITDPKERYKKWARQKAIDAASN